MRLKSSRPRSSKRMLLSLLVMLCIGCALLFILSAEARTPRNKSRVTPSAFEDPEAVRRYQQSITPEALAARLYFLASDAMEGREATTRGQKLAADYLASQYRSMGLLPKGTVKADDALSLRSYFQPFKLYKRTARRTELELKIGSERVTSRFSQDEQDDLSFFAFGKVATVAPSGVVFAGYGIADDALAYNDLAALKERGISLDGKWVMILADEPLRDASTSLLPTKDRKPSKWSTRIYDKKDALWRAGRPAGILVISDATARAPEGGFIGQARNAALSLRGAGALSLFPASEQLFPPTYYVSTKFADRLLAASGRNVKDLMKEIEGSLKPSVFDIKGAELSARAELFEPLETENVLAFIEGSDPKLKDEVVVVSSHYDHLGMNAQLKGDQIFNGAADDGSGTVATLAIAEALMKAKRDGLAPRRSILFLNTSGEEKGIQGSAFYTDTQPVIPLDRIAADINMDGIGGEDTAHAKTNPNYVYIIGRKEMSGELLEITKRLNQLTGTNLFLDEQPNFSPNASDHFNFDKNLVPYIFYSTGLTEHYHKTSDEPQTINYEHMALATRLSFATVWQVANADSAPARVNRDRITLKGYQCPTCTLACDTLDFEAPGVCPVCEMPLAPKFEVRK
jgi:hypothetical protein